MLKALLLLFLLSLSPSLFGVVHCANWNQMTEAEWLESESQISEVLAIYSVFKHQARTFPMSTERIHNSKWLKKRILHLSLDYHRQTKTDLSTGAEINHSFSRIQLYFSQLLTEELDQQIRSEFSLEKF